MRWYKFGGIDSWIKHPGFWISEDPWIAFYHGWSINNHFCYVYEDEDLIAVIDIKPWITVSRYSIMQHKEGLQQYLQSELDKVLKEKVK